MSKLDLPNSVTGGLNYVSEKQKYLQLFEASSRTQVGQTTFTATLSGITYNTVDYPLDATIYNKGDEGMLQLLKNTLADYLLIASDINTLSTQISTVKGITDQYYLTTNTTGNIGSIVLDGSNDYGTIPATVGQLSTAASTFELLIKFKPDSTANAQMLMSKYDTAYSSSATVKGWHIARDSDGVSASRLILSGRVSNGGTESNITSAYVIPHNIIAWAKVTFDGTTVTLYYSLDGVNFTSLGTSTNANLIAGLSTSDNVLTQIGRSWQGSSSYGSYSKGTIYQIKLTKAGVITNNYLFQNYGVDQTVIDAVSAANGVSAGTVTQGVSGTKYVVNPARYASGILDDNRILIEPNVTAGTSIQPTINIDSFGEKPIVGVNMTIGKTYELRYQSDIECFVAIENVVILSKQIFTTSGTFTAPKSGVYKVTVQASGGTGGSTASQTGSGGGGGGSAIKYISLAANQAVTVTVGTTAGASSSFGSYCSATGGSNGGSVASGFTAGGTGGAGTGGDINISGQKGGYAGNTAGGSYCGAGGSSLLGVGGAMALTSGSSVAGNDGVGYGAGGSGASNGSTAGLFTQGIVIVEYV